MGLAGAKNKRKLGNDPNNTKWSRNTDTFGQKMLRAQGWQPGQYLGAKDAPHAEWHTEANTTHIRVTLKDDTLGLGAKRNNGDECTGLDAFQHLLGRLNGKSDDTLETERKVREDLKLNLYMERKIGAIRFVKGGWLVGDQVKETPDENAVEPQSEAVSDDAKDSEASSASESTEPKSKKRKADEDAQPDDEKARKKEKSKKRKTDSDAESDHVKEKKDKKKSKKRRTESEEEEEASSKSSKGKKEKKLKKDKKEKKEKKDKKEKKEKKKDRAASDSGTEEDSTSKEKKRRQDKSSVSTPAESGASTPSGSGYSTPVTTSTRYLARSRFIAQKKMAFADSAALNQVSLTIQPQVCKIS
ncbi:telomerase inhibitor [Collariella sp. IMI 366227]|nr:telomerase inhibitor [Collariella sp. IMI 366227]